ncbi:hypothetical protein D3Z36_09710 [Lachnospiraceae bacterium]|nr:hypothetical protein [Lachnospiraceae bacterium]
MKILIISCDTGILSGYPFMPLGNKEENVIVRYQTSFATAAGDVCFENETCFLKKEDGYKLVWTDALIYAGLSCTDKVRVSTMQAKMGEILDRNGRILAGAGVASSVGIVPGSLENMDSAIGRIDRLLEMKPEEIQKKLSEKWVKDDSFVLLRTLRKVQEIGRMTR